MADEKEDIHAKRKRLLYQSWYRGTKETDLILGPFAREYLESMDAGELDAYHRLLNESDVDIYNWVTGQADVPDFVDAKLMKKLRDFWKQAA